jgi:L-2-hydroxyglutarate oxidase LhgO
MIDSGRLGPEQRAEHLRRLRSECFDLIVVGGGVTGTGVAPDAATRCLSVALLEAGDLAGGTSSRSGKTLHGGLRYLEQRNFSWCARQPMNAISPSSCCARTWPAPPIRVPPQPSGLGATVPGRGHAAV